MLTVSDVFADLDVRLLAGEAGASAPVRWVHISELADPTPFLSGGELLLTTGMALDSAKAQREYVARLADHGLAGLGYGIGFGHQKVPKAAVDAAEARGFPLYEVPYDTPFIAVTERAFTRLVNEQYALLRRSIAAQERLQRIVLSERGLDAIVAGIAALVGGPAIVFDGRGELEALHTFRRELQPETVAALGDELQGRARRGDARGFVPAHPDLAARALALPVGSPDGPDDGLPQAWLVAAKDTGGLAEIDRLILHQAVTVIALELLRRRVADSTERRLAGDVLSAAVAGDLEGAELARRLEPFGLGGRVTTLVLAPADRRADAVEAALGDALRGEAVSGLVAQHGRFVGALLPGFLDDELAEVTARITARVAEQTGAVAGAGAGRALPAGRVRESWHEARFALEARELTRVEHGGAGPTVNGTQLPVPDVATYRDLGSFRLLLSLQDTEALRLYCDSLLAPIETGDGHYGGELMRSLEAFIECNGQWEAAARRLYCHRHTLRYR
ncbi:MAG TPA: PucR family transcriptional regulator, partial [Solirubrobacteraceae bacterium]|nr:PucR family transcriptional regulator [Solirubrobacteraceae bacterium]